MTKVRIGAGAGYAGDRIKPAVDLIEAGELDYIVFECLAERTIALAQLAKSRDAKLGYDPLLEARMRKVLPALKQHGTRIISNMGAANPLAAMAKSVQVAKDLGIGGLDFAAVTGDDVIDLFRSGDLDQIPTMETGAPVSSLQGKVISANAYIGADPIVQALRDGADVVLGGRIADPALFLAPLIYEFGWTGDDFELLGRGIIVGHLLECAGQLSGGYFSDPPYKQPPDLAHLGFPFADVAADGNAEFSKLEGSGGEITLATCKEQLLYEIHDPSQYLTPDVTADFSNVELQQVAANRVSVRGGAGAARPNTLKVSIGYRDGFIGEGQISYAGGGAESRGKLAIDVVRQQLAEQHCAVEDLRCELIGVNSIQRGPKDKYEAPEVRVRIAGRTQYAEEAELLAGTVEALYTNGPAGGGGVSRSVRPIVAIASALIPRALVSVQVHREAVR